MAIGNILMADGRRAASLRLLQKKRGKGGGGGGGTSRTYTYTSDSPDTGEGRINYTTGAIEGVTGTKYFAYVQIPVETGQKVVFTPDSTGSYTGGGGTFGYAFYDASMQYISGAQGVVGEENTVDVPSNAAWFRYGRQRLQYDTPAYGSFIVQTPGYNPLSSLTWNAVGDSITANGQYLASVSQAMGISYNKLAVHGSTLAINNSYLENQSIVERVCGLNGNTPYEDADLWSVMGGVNDAYYETPLGSIQPIGSTFDNTTIYGALQSIVENIMARQAHTRLLLITPTHSRNDSLTSPSVQDIVDAFEAVGNLYAVPVCNMFKLGGINMANAEGTYPTTVDGLHPNDAGGAAMAAPITAYLKMLLYDYI